MGHTKSIAFTMIDQDLLAHQAKATEAPQPSINTAALPFLVATSRPAENATSKAPRSTRRISSSRQGESAAVTAASWLLGGIAQLVKCGRASRNNMLYRGAELQTLEAPAWSD